MKNPTPSNLVVGLAFGIVSREMVDANADGLGDVVKLTFSRFVQDSSVVAGQFSVCGPGGTASGQARARLGGISGDAVDNDVVYLDVGNVYAGDEQPFIQHTGVDSLKALNGRALGQEPSGVVAADKVAPILSRVQTISRNGRTTILATFSEPLTSRSTGRCPWRYRPTRTATRRSKFLFPLTSQTAPRSK